MTDNSNLTAYAKKNEHEEKIKSIASELGINVIYKESNDDSEDLTLNIDENGLFLSENGLVMRGDFSHMLPRLKQNNLGGELIVKASKIKSFGKNPIAVDATAGMGEDSLLLAAAGFNVILFEYNPIIASLLRDAIRRASDMAELSEIVNRMELHEEDSINGLKDLDSPPDLILLDPMFPERRKSSLVKKKFQLIHTIEEPCNNEKELLQSAINAHPKKIIIKRPSKGPFLAGMKPSYSISGKGIRYDCIVLS